MENRATVAGVARLQAVPEVPATLDFVLVRSIGLHSTYDSGYESLCWIRLAVSHLECLDKPPSVSPPNFGGRQRGGRKGVIKWEVSTLNRY